MGSMTVRRSGMAKDLKYANRFTEGLDKNIHAPHFQSQSEPSLVPSARILVDHWLRKPNFPPPERLLSSSAHQKL